LSIHSEHVVIGGGEALQIKLPPFQNPISWGHSVDAVWGNADAKPEKLELKFAIRFTTSQSHLHQTERNFTDFFAGADTSYKVEGDAPPVAVLLADGSRCSMQPVVGENGRLCGVTSIDTIISPDVRSAFLPAMQIGSALLLWLTVQTQVPSYVEAVKLDSINPEGYGGVQFTVPYPVVGVNFRDLRCVPILMPILQIFTEGLRATSQLYRFFCFYQVVFALQITAVERMKHVFAQNGLKMIPMDDVFPSDKFEDIAKEFCGRSFSEVRHELHAPRRNAIAHFDPRKGILPVDPAIELLVSKGAVAMHYASTILVDYLIDNLMILQSAGAPIPTKLFVEKK
jgi:hypothetical protein